MSKNIFVDYEGKHAKVKCNDFNSFKEGIERKLRVSLNDHRLEYHNTSRDEWIGIFDDDDLEDITEETQVRLISESGAPSGGVSIAAHGNKNVGQIGHHNEDKRITAGRIAGRDYIDGDKITARNMSKVDKFEGTMHIGGRQNTTSNTFSGPISGDQLHFGVGRNIKK